MIGALDEPVDIGEPRATHVERVAQEELSLVEGERLSVHAHELLPRRRICAVAEVRGQAVGFFSRRELSARWQQRTAIRGVDTRSYAPTNLADEGLDIALLVPVYLLVGATCRTSGA